MPLVSVIVPTYNYGEFLPQTLDSALAQTFGDLEVIVVDDGSTDCTRKVVSEYFDKRVRYVWQRNQGSSAARNRGMRMAEGKYIALLDADDLWDEEKLALQVALLEAEPGVGVAFTDFLIFRGDEVLLPSKFKSMRRFYDLPIRESARGGRVLMQNIFKDLLEVGGFIFTPTLLFRKECLERVGFFNERFRLAEDTDFCLRLAKHYHFGYFDRILVKVRRHGKNISSDEVAHCTQAIEVLSAMLEEFDDLDREQARALHRKLGAYCYGVGWHHFDRGAYAQARELFRSSLRHGKSLKALPLFWATFLDAPTVNKIRRWKRRLSFF